ncbi:MAG: BlaI/MecI/CopY family transcriptional regulator [Saprospiraceae bacterium]
MKRELLTSREESIMQIIWKIGPCTMSQIMDYLKKSNKKDSIPAPTTVSTFLRILLDKNYLNFKAYGKTYEYYSEISKLEYASIQLRNMIQQYFSNKPEELVSFIVNEEEMDELELQKLLSELIKKSK